MRHVFYHPIHGIVPRATPELQATSPGITSVFRNIAFSFRSLNRYCMIYSVSRIRFVVSIQFCGIAVRKTEVIISAISLAVSYIVK